MLLGLLALFISLLFGSTVVPIGVKITTPLIGPLLFVFLRFFVSTLLLFLLVFFSKRKKIRMNEYKEFALLGFLLAINVIFFALGISYTTIIMSTLIYAITPILVGIAGHFFLDEPLNKRKILGLLVAFAGLLFLVSQSLSKNQQNAFGEPLGNILIFFCVLGYSYYVFQSRKVLHTMNHYPLQTTFLTFVFTTIFALVVLLFALTTGNAFIKPLPNEGIVGIMVVSVGTVALYLLLQVGIKRTSAFTASLLSYISPFIAAAVSIPLLHEQVTPELIIGGILILAGVFTATTYGELKPNVIKS
jgi:drug/metabolite transporter (DMT)-like permease